MNVSKRLKYRWVTPVAHLLVFYSGGEILRSHIDDLLANKNVPPKCYLI